MSSRARSMRPARRKVKRVTACAPQFWVLSTVIAGAGKGFAVRKLSPLPTPSVFGSYRKRVEALPNFALRGDFPKGG